MSGSAGGNRIPRSAVEKTVQEYIDKVLSKIPGFKSAKISGSYNTSAKEDFGDIDLITSFEGGEKTAFKKELAKYLESLPDDVIIPFKSEKYKGKKTLNTGEIVTILYPISGMPDEFVQIDNIIALSDEEGEFKKTFLDYPAEVQGLILGLVKVVTLEEDPKKVLQKMGITNVPPLDQGQEYEFNLSSSGLTLRIVTLDQDYKQLDRTEVWKSSSWSDVKKLLSNYNLDKSFEDLLSDLKALKNERSKNRIKGIFKSMVSIKSGEVGTPKGEKKQYALDQVATLEEKYGSFITNLIRPLLEANGEQTVAIYPGGFKPPHRGHLQVIQNVSSKVDKVIVIYSTKTRQKPGQVPITATQTADIWQLYIDKGLIPGNVEIKPAQTATPVEDAYQIMKANPNTNYIALYGKDEEGAWKSIEKYKKQGEYLNVVPTSVGNFGGFNATAIRTALANKDMETLQQSLPDGVTTDEYIQALKGNSPQPNPEPIQEGKGLKKLRVFDFDDTLAHIQALIRITHQDGSVEELTPAEYAVYTPQTGDKFNFSDFNKVIKQAHPIEDNVQDLIRSYNDPTEKTTILTARMMGYPVKKYLKDEFGIEPYVVGLGSSDPMDKAKWIEQQIHKGYNDIEFRDDSQKNVDAVATLKDKYPDVKLVSMLAESYKGKRTNDGAPGTFKAKITKAYGGPVTIEKAKKFKNRENATPHDKRQANWFINFHSKNEGKAAPYGSGYEPLEEGKQVGPLYHYTSADGLKGILNSDRINASEEHYLGNDLYYISFTRNKNFHNKGSKFGVKTDYRITLDGDKLSNRYKITPFAYKPGWNYEDNWEYNWLEDEPENVVRDFFNNTGDYDEQEERISFKGPEGGIDNIKNYILSIDKVEDVQEDEKNKLDPVKENYEFKISDKDYDSEDNSLITVEYKFSTPDNTYRVEFYSGEYSPKSKIFDVSFGLDKGYNYKLDTFQMTGEGNASSILKTVVNIIIDFTNKFEVNKLVINPTSEKREKVYSIILKSLPSNILNKIELIQEANTAIPYGSGYKPLEETLEPLIAELTKYMYDQGLSIDPAPSIEFIEDESNAENIFGRTAYYDPQHQHIVVYVTNRHPKDILRSFAHEMIHHAQNLEGKLANSPKTTDINEDDHLKELEREAYQEGNMLFRGWENSRNKQVMAEGKYDSLSNLLSSKIFNKWKEDFEAGKDEGRFEEYVYDEKTGLEFDLTANAIFTDEDIYSVDGGANQGSETEDAFIHAQFVIDRESLPRLWEKVSFDLKDFIRHEIEHLTQSGTNILPGKRRYQQQSRRDKIKAGEIPTYKYATLRDEIEPMLQGMYFSAKKQRRPFRDVVEDWFDSRNFNNQEKMEILKIWKPYLKKLSLPNL